MKKYDVHDIPAKNANLLTMDLLNAQIIIHQCTGFDTRLRCHLKTAANQTQKIHEINNKEKKKIYAKFQVLFTYITNINTSLIAMKNVPLFLTYCHHPLHSHQSRSRH